MSKTSQENKVKKAKVESVEVQDNKLEQKAVTEETSAEETTETVDTANHKVRTAKVRGKKYQKAKKLIDITKYYPISEAVKLVKQTSFSKFVGKVEAHVTVADMGNIGEINFPHLESASKKVVILNDAILEEIKVGQINFDILIATPVTMPKLLPLARILGPKGLMPNPKKTVLLLINPKIQSKNYQQLKQLLELKRKLQSFIFLLEKFLNQKPNLKPM